MGCRTHRSPSLTTSRPAESNPRARAEMGPRGVPAPSHFSDSQTTLTAPRVRGFIHLLRSRICRIWSHRFVSDENSPKKCSTFFVNRRLFFHPFFYMQPRTDMERRPCPLPVGRRCRTKVITAPRPGPRARITRNVSGRISAFLASLFIFCFLHSLFPSPITICSLGDSCIFIGHVFFAIE